MCVCVCVGGDQNTIICFDPTAFKHSTGGHQSSAVHAHYAEC